MFGYIVDFFCFLVGHGLFLRILCMLVCIPFAFINKKEQRFHFLKLPSTQRSVGKNVKRVGFQPGGWICSFLVFRKGPVSRILSSTIFRLLKNWKRIKKMTMEGIFFFFLIYPLFFPLEKC